MRTLVFVGLVTGLLSSAVAQAQVVPANDVGMSVAPSTFSFSSLPEPQGPGATCPTGPVAGSFTGTTVQNGRIFRDALPSACPGKAYPGIFNAATTFNYESYTYTNTSGAAACVTVNFDPDTVGTTPVLPTPMPVLISAAMIQRIKRQTSLAMSVRVWRSRFPSKSQLARTWSWS